MVKKFKELVLKKDTVFNESIEVDGDIRCEGGSWSLRVKGNINVENINALDIDALDINSLDITARNINALDISALNISALDIICESRKKKSKTSKTIARIFIQNKSQLERKEQMPEK